MTKPHAGGSLRLTFKVNIPAEAELVVKMPDGSTRPPTEEELYTLGYRHVSTMYLRTAELLNTIGLEDEEQDEYTTLRYFVEHITHWDHAPDEEMLDAMRALISKSKT